MTICGDYVLRFRNDVYCAGWGVKLYSLTHPDDYVP